MKQNDTIWSTPKLFTAPPPPTWHRQHFCGATSPFMAGWTVLTEMFNVLRMTSKVFFPQGIQVGFHSRPYQGKNKLQYGMWWGDTKTGRALSRLHVFQEFSWTLVLVLSAWAILTHSSERCQPEKCCPFAKNCTKTRIIRLAYLSSNTTKNLIEKPVNNQYFKRKIIFQVYVTMHH